MVVASSGSPWLLLRSKTLVPISPTSEWSQFRYCCSKQNWIPCSSCSTCTRALFPWLAFSVPLVNSSPMVYWLTARPEMWWLSHRGMAAQEHIYSLDVIEATPQMYRHETGVTQSSVREGYSGQCQGRGRWHLSCELSRSWYQARFASVSHFTLVKGDLKGQNELQHNYIYKA